MITFNTVNGARLRVNPRIVELMDVNPLPLILADVTAAFLLSTYRATDAQGLALARITRRGDAFEDSDLDVLTGHELDAEIDADGTVHVVLGVHESVLTGAGWTYAGLAVDDLETAVMRFKNP